MPRAPRADQASGLYHALNRGNIRATIFHKEPDLLPGQKIGVGVRCGVGCNQANRLLNYCRRGLESCLGIEFEANRLGFKTETDASKRLVDRIGLGT